MDIRLPGNRNSDSHGLRPVNQIIPMITWIRTSRFSIKNSPSCHRRGCPKIRQQSRSTVGGERPAIRAGRGSCRSAADPSPGSTLFAEEDSVRPPKENLVRIPNENSVRTPKANSVRPPKENPARLSKTEFSQSFKREFDQADPSLGSTLFPTKKEQKGCCNRQEAYSHGGNDVRQVATMVDLSCTTTGSNLRPHLSTNFSSLTQNTPQTFTEHPSYRPRKSAGSLFVKCLALSGFERYATLGTPPSPVQKLTDQRFSWY